WGLAILTVLGCALFPLSGKYLIEPMYHQVPLMTQSNLIIISMMTGMAMLLPFALNVTGCAANLPQVAVECPQLPLMPSASTPQPSVPYLKSVQGALKKWREALRDTPPTP
ncbi:MAG: hypothetical protein WCP99_23595, partial [Burkholderiales bacterium]